MALATSKYARSQAKIRLRCKLSCQRRSVLQLHTCSLISAYIYFFFSFQVVAATNRVDILDPALLRSGLSSTIISLFFRFFFMYARCFHFLKSIQGNVGLELFPWIKILMLAALFTIDSVTWYGIN